MGVDMFGCRCFRWSRIDESLEPELETFSMPAPIPQWPEGQGFATGTINLGEIEVCELTDFDFIWSFNPSLDKKRCCSFFKPSTVPEGYFSLGHYCQSNDRPLRGYVLVAREVSISRTENSCHCSQDHAAALVKPLDYMLVWSTFNGIEESIDECGNFWWPQPPEGYKSMGFVVTSKPHKPELEEVRCVRADLTDQCEVHRLICTNSYSKSSELLPFRVWNTRPCDRGMQGKGVSVGSFFCSSSWSSGEGPDSSNIVCLKNLNAVFHAMPNLDQIHSLVRHYGPTVFFHPNEIYLPSSVEWFFENGALLYRNGESVGQAIDHRGANLPCGGWNDGEYWIDLPNDDRREHIKRGNIESSKLYVHVKPAFGGTYTDIALWIFCPFNGPGTLKIGVLSVALGKIGQHVGDWEHFTLRLSNFTGELWRIYFSQHSGGVWVDVSDLEFLAGNKAIVYSSKSGHASFPHQGNYIQGSSKLGIGVRNDAALSSYIVDSSKDYEIVAAEYLGKGIVSEPCWLQYMRQWGPKIVYDSRTELNKIINTLPLLFRLSVQNFFNKFPLELYGEEGPTGPKEKNNWADDERCNIIAALKRREMWKDDLN